MKVKKIGALCKAEGICYLYDELTEEGEIRRQWICNGVALWPVSGLPQLRESNLSTLFDFSAETVKKMRIKEEELPQSLYAVCHDLRDGEPEMQESIIRIIRDGEELMALISGPKITWLKSALLAPCWTKETKLLRRTREDGMEDVAVCDGLFLNGLIMPAIVQDQVFRELLRLGCSAPAPVVPQEETEDEDEDEE